MHISPQWPRPADGPANRPPALTGGRPQRLRLWLISGTGEGPPLAGALLARGWRLKVSVVTAAAARAYPRHPDLELAVGPLGAGCGESPASAVAAELRRARDLADPYLWLVDATHPFARQISAALAQACRRQVQPLPVGRVLLSGIDAGGFFIESGELFFLADEPWNPFLLVEGEGWFANQLIHAFAFGPLSECKWILSSGGDSVQSPQDLFLAVAKGWVPVATDGMGPVDMKLYEDSREGVQRAVSSRIEADSIWRNGVKFSESMDFAPGAGIFPIDSFRSGFEWRLDPVF